jgi:DNA-nicking Smr family endonuclease
MPRLYPSAPPPDLSIALLRVDLPTLDLHGCSRWETEYELFHFLKDYPGQVVQIITGHGGGVVAETTLNYLRPLVRSKRVLNFAESEDGGRLVVALA